MHGRIKSNLIHVICKLQLMFFNDYKLCDQTHKLSNIKKSFFCNMECSFSLLSKMLIRTVQLLIFTTIFASKVFSYNHSVIHNTDIDDFDYAQENETITKTVANIISTFYIETTSVINFFSCSSNYESNSVTGRIINKILKQMDSKVLTLLEDCDNIIATDRKKFFNIFFIDTYDSFRKIIFNMASGDFDYQGYYIIVLTELYDDYEVRYREIKKIFEDLWSDYIINVNIVQVSIQELSKCSLLTYFPYTETFCEEVHPVVINTYNIESGFEKQTSVFPNKMKNLYQCPITAAIFEIPPFVMIDENSFFGIRGFDGIFLHQLSQRMNFTFLKKTLQRRSWGFVSENGSSSGAIKMVMQKRVNLTIGFFISSADKKRWMASSYEYYTTYLVWVIPPAGPMTASERFSKPFRPYIWIFVTFTFICGVIVTFILGCTSRRVRNFVYGSNIRNPIMNMTNVLFGGSLVRLPRRNFARSLLALYMIYTFVIRNAYTGALFRFLQLSNSRQDVQNMDDMLKKNYKFLVLDNLIEYVQPFDMIFQKSIMYDNKELDGIVPLLLNSKNKYALLASEDHVAYWNKQGYPRIFFEVCEQKATPINLCMYLPKTSCLTAEINKYIFDFNSNGLMQIWKHIYIDKSYLQKKILNTEPKTLTMEQLVGAYYLFFNGLIAATLCFFVEILIKILKRF